MSEVVSPAPELESETPAPAAKKPRKVRAPKHDFKDGRGKVFAHRHVNGNGWVEDTAKVSDTVFVSKLAQVYQNAVVEGNARIRDRANVAGSAYVRDAAEVRNLGFVGGNTMLYDDSKVTEKAAVYGGTICGTSMIKGNATIREYPFIRDSTVENHARITGYTQLLRSHVYGDVYLMNNIVIIASTLSGYITIKNNAKILSSSLIMSNKYRTHATDESGHLLITDDVMIVGCQDFHAFLHIKGHTRIVGGNIRLSPEYNRDQQQYVRAETIDSAVFPNARIRNMSDFEAYNNADITRRAGTSHAVLASLPPRREPFDFAAATGRRLISMGDNK